MFSSGGTVTIKELGNITASSLLNSALLEFPIIQGTSPCCFTINWGTNATEFTILISELGGIPDPNYFNDTPTTIPEWDEGEPERS